jgi:hypothetical protein
VDLPQATIDFARTQVGVEEEPRGSNSSPIIDGYLRNVDLPPGKAWCAAFVSFCVDRGAFDIATTSTLKPSGGALKLYFKNPHLAIPHPEPNTIGVQDHGKGLGHVFFITDVQGGMCSTLEGNTDPQGGREGYTVAERTRATSTIDYFMRIG